MELTQAVSRNIVATKYENLPTEAKEATKRSILDTLGVMFPSTTQEQACAAVADIVKETGGREESTLIGFGGKSSCLNAAFVNGSLTHAMDYDDTTDDPPYHPTACVLPSTLAIAEKAGKVSGKDFMTAVALGNDLGVRLSAALKEGAYVDYPWFNVTNFGTFCAAGATGKILGLSEDQMINALGIAVSRVFGVGLMLVAPNSQMRAIRDGFTNKEGLLSALMAGKGIKGCNDAIEKFFKVYYRDEYDARALTTDLGKKFRGAEASIKPWPACRSTHACIHAALEIVNDKGVEPDQIQDVLMTVSKNSQNNCEPLEVRRNPKLSIDAKFSLPFAVAVALSKKKVEITNFLPQNLNDPKVLEMAKKINYKVDPTFGLFTPVTVDVKTRDGKMFSSRVEVIYGNPQKPLSQADLLAKFKDCIRYGKKPLSNKVMEQLIGKILNLEDVKDMTEITRLLR